jgi:mannose-1-phosphate guanylyltransferase
LSEPFQPIDPNFHDLFILIQPVVLSGGSGTRLWPLSREKYPKQLLSLVGEDSLLQATVRRTTARRV